MSSHFAPLESSRLQKLMEAFQTYRIIGKKPTTIELQEYTRSCNISADITEARKNGVNIKCRFVETRNGRKISEFWIEQQTELSLA